MTTLLAQPMSAYGTFGFACGTVPGASEDALQIAERCRDLFRAFARSATGNERLEEPLQTLEEVFERCRLPDWDGDGATPIARDAVADAQAILVSLPLRFPLPEIYAEGTGAIVLEWYRGQGRRYVATVAGNGTVEFAGLAGPGNELYGELRLNGAMPKQMRDQLSDLYLG